MRIDRIGLAALPQRFREAPRTTRIHHADFHLAVGLQGQGQIETVIATSFQADTGMCVSPQQVSQKGLVSSGIVGKACDNFPVLAPQRTATLNSRALTSMPANTWTSALELFVISTLRIGIRLSPGSPTLYNLSTDLVNTGSSGLGFSTAWERRAGGPSIIQATNQVLCLRLRSGLPPKPDLISNYHGADESGRCKQDTRMRLPPERATNRVG
jgi:hypothetical protein